MHNNAPELNHQLWQTTLLTKLATPLLMRSLLADSPRSEEKTAIHWSPVTRRELGIKRRWLTRKADALRSARLVLVANPSSTVCQLHEIGQLQVKFFLTFSLFFRLSGWKFTLCSSHFTIHPVTLHNSGVSEHSAPRAAERSTCANGRRPDNPDRISWIASLIAALFFQIALNTFSNLFYCVCVHALIWINRKSSKPAGFFCSPVTCVWCLHSESGKSLFQCLFHCLPAIFSPASIPNWNFQRTV